MADLAVWQRTIVDEKGNIIPGAEVEVRSYPGGSLITLYRGPDGEQIKSNPFRTGEDGFARFWAESQRAEIIAHGAGSTIRWIVDLLNADEVIGDAVTEATAAAADAVSEAKAEADRAEAARDAAQLNAHIYPSTSDGLAATTDGDYFSVPSDDSDEYLILYRNDNGSAEEVERYPSAEAVKPFVSPAITNNDWDAITRSGFYSNTTNSAVGLPASRTWLTLLHVEKADNFAHQLAIRQHPDTPQMWMRTRGGPQPTDPVTWGEWHEIAYKSDVIPPLTTDSLNWNEVHRTGYYINSSSSAVGLPTDVPGMAMMHIERDDGGAEQIAMRQNSAAPQVWRRFRGYGTGEWTEWTEFLTEHHLASLISADTQINNDWDTITKTGFYRNTAVDAVGIPMQRRWLTLQHIEKPDGFAHQIAIRQNPGDPKMWLRTRGGAFPGDPPDWSDWAEIAFTSDFAAGFSSHVPIRAANEYKNLTLSLAGGPIENRPSLSDPDIHNGASGDALLFVGEPVTIARRGLVPLGPDAMGIVARVRAVTAIRSAGHEPLTRLDVGVAWYNRHSEPASTPLTTFAELPDYNELLTTFDFTVSRQEGADLVAPDDAMYFTPFVHAEMEGSQQQLLVLFLDVKEEEREQAKSLFNYVRKADVSGLPYELFTSEDESAFDFTNPGALEYEQTDGEVDHVLAVWGDRRVRRYASDSRARFGTLYGRYALQGSEDDTRMLFQTRNGSAARAIPPESQEATIVISHVTLDDVRKVIFWQSTPDAPGRLQLHCNASYDGSGVRRVPGAVNLFVGGASGGRGINGQPLAGSHPPGVPSVFSIVLRPPGQLSEFRQNGRVIDTFEAPGVFADASSDIFGRSGVFSSDDRTGAAYSRIAVLHRAVNERELNLLEAWAGAGFGIRPFDPHNQPVEVADLTCDFAAVCKLPNVPPSAMRGKPFPLLFERNPDGLAMPASLTKVMTAIVMLDNIQSLHEKVEVTEADITGGTGQNISPGDIITYRDALYNLMLPSSNRAGLLIGRTVGEKMLAVENETGDPVDRFVAEMNRYAEMFDMTNTNYVNPHGVTDEQFTTARDMLKLGIQATAYKELMWVWGTPTYSMQVEGPNARTVNLTNTTIPIVDPDSTTESFGRRIAYGAKTGNLGGSVDPEWRGRTMLAMVEAPDGGVLLGCVLRASSTPELRTRDVKRIFDAASAVVLRE